jgi:CBS domain-containing protein
MYKTNSNFIRTLTEKRLSESKELYNNPYVCSWHENLLTVWKQFIERNITHCPVMNKYNNNFYGFLDIRDIVCALIDGIKESSNVTDLLENDEKFKQLKVGDVVSSKRNGPGTVIIRQHTFYFILEIFARVYSVHRTAIVDKSRNYPKLINMITQIEVINYLHKMTEDSKIIGSILFKPLSKIESVFKEVITVSEEDQAIVAFKLMVKNNIGGVGVVNKKGELVGALSLQDMKMVSNEKEYFIMLYGTVSKLINYLHVNVEGRPYYVKTLEYDDSILDAINVLHKWKLHRVFVVKNYKPVGIVSIRNVLSEILYN